MFRHRIGRRSDLCQQTRRRRGVQQISLAAFEHLRQYGSRGEDMRHYIDFPNLPPGFVRDLLETRHAADARVRAEEVNGTESFVGFCDEVADVRFAGDVGFDGQAIDLGGDLRGPVEINVRNHDASRAFGGEASAKRAADAVRASGDDYYFVLQIHLVSPSPGWITLELMYFLGLCSRIGLSVTDWH